VPRAVAVDHLPVPRQSIVIRLELRVADDSLTGRVSDSSGAARDFVGWVGLVAAIDAFVPSSAPVPRAPTSMRTVDEGGPV
jgi:hypothetical protein